MIFLKRNNKYSRTTGGYTLVELIVAVGLFIIVVLMSASAFLGVVSSNRKTLAMQTAMDNISSAIENMSRDMKTGFSYRCEHYSALSGDINIPRDCSSGGAYIAFEGQEGDPSDSSDQIIYQLGPAGPLCPSAEQICKSVDGGSSFFAITAPPPELSITGVSFRVFGSSNVDSRQARIVVIIRGTSGIDEKSKSTFDIETTISQRTPDQFL